MVSNTSIDFARRRRPRACPQHGTERLVRLCIPQAYAAHGAPGTVCTSRLAASPKHQGTPAGVRVENSWQSSRARPAPARGHLCITRQARVTARCARLRPPASRATPLRRSRAPCEVLTASYAAMLTTGLQRNPERDSLKPNESRRGPVFARNQWHDIVGPPGQTHHLIDSRRGRPCLHLSD